MKDRNNMEWIYYLIYYFTYDNEGRKNESLIRNKV